MSPGAVLKVYLQVSKFHGCVGINCQCSAQVQCIDRSDLGFENKIAAIGGVRRRGGFTHWSEGVHVGFAGLAISCVKPVNAISTCDDIRMGLCTIARYGYACATAMLEPQVTNGCVSSVFAEAEKVVITSYRVNSVGFLIVNPASAEDHGTGAGDAIPNTSVAQCGWLVMVFVEICNIDIAQIQSCAGTDCHIAAGRNDLAGDQQVGRGGSHSTTRYSQQAGHEQGFFQRHTVTSI